MSSIIKVPRSFMNLGKLKLGMNVSTFGLIAVAGVALWFFGINPDTRKFDLMGMLKLPTLGGGSTPAQIPAQAQDLMSSQGPYASLDPIEVTDALKPGNAPPPEIVTETPSDLKVTTIASAYNTSQVSIEDSTVLPRKVAGLM